MARFSGDSQRPSTTYLTEVSGYQINIIGERTWLWETPFGGYTCVLPALWLSEYLIVEAVCISDVCDHWSPQFAGVPGCWHILPCKSVFWVTGELMHHCIEAAVILQSCWFSTREAQRQTERHPKGSPQKPSESPKRGHRSLRIASRSKRRAHRFARPRFVADPSQRCTGELERLD